VRHVQQNFPKVEIMVPSLLHHLSQRFDISSKNDVSEFLKSLVKECGDLDSIEKVFDDFSADRCVIITEQMRMNYKRASYQVFFDYIEVPKLASGITAQG
jgi:hypothetical protein